MKHRLLLIALALTSLGGAARAQSIKLLGADYLPRWSQDDQHEYTPKGQEDLEHWKDMVTVNYYPDAKDGEKLAGMANAVLENYKSHGASVLRTDSVPRTATKPAEFLIVVLFPTPDFFEVVFARLRDNAGAGGMAIIYSHREYGKKVNDAVSAWIGKNGPVVEKALMELGKAPTAEETRKALKKG